MKPENDLTTEAMLHREAIRKIHKLQDALTKIAQMRPHHQKENTITPLKNNHARSQTLLVHT